MSLRLAPLLALAAMSAGCGSDTPITTVPPAFAIRNDRVAVDPNGRAPLVATIHVETSAPASVSVRVAGRNGPSSDVGKGWDVVGTVHDVPVLGLYPGGVNTVDLTFKDAGGAELARKTYSITTAPLPPATYPQISIDTRRAGLLAPGMTLVSYFGFRTSNVPQTPFIFDEFGDVRWYLDFSTTPVLSALFYDNGVERLQNGNLYFGDGATDTIYEVDMLGRIVGTWVMPGFDFHHNVQEKPNGNFLVTVSRQGLATIEDFVIEIDRVSRQVIRTWDLRTSLQYGRRTLTSDGHDWIHVNAVAHDARDNTIIISGRTQGVVKLDENNRVVWILGAHRGWGTAGDGTDLRTKLLQPLDRNGVSITDPALLDGTASHPDFEWSWYQHAPLVMPSGHVLIFDNGDNRNFGGAPAYSRAAEYDIDDVNRTVRQAWTYGKERGAATYSRIVSDVDYLAAQNRVIFSPGAINSATNTGKVIEIDRATGQVMFEATLTPPQTFFGITLHRTERLSLYP